MASRYDDELWELVPDGPREPPEHLREFVESLAARIHALDLGCGDGVLTVHLGAERFTAADVSAVALERARRHERIAAEDRVVELEPDAPLPVRRRRVRPGAVRRDDRARTRPPAAPLGGAARAAPGWHARDHDPGDARADAAAAEPLSPHLRFLTRRSLGALLDELGFEVASLERRAGSLLARATR